MDGYATLERKTRRESITDTDTFLIWKERIDGPDLQRHPALG